MALTRSFRETVMKQVREDPAFRAALVEEAARNVVEGDVETALGQLRDVVNATMGFDTLAADTGLPKTSLMRMLGENGNPRAVNLSAILRAVGQRAGVRISVHATPVGEMEAAE
jgi:DNA-binding phage protein